EAAGGEDRVERVAVLEGQDDGVLRQDVRGEGGEVVVAEARRRRRGDRGGTERLLRWPGAVSDDQREGDDDRKDSEIRSRPPHKPTQSIADGEQLLHWQCASNRGRVTFGMVAQGAQGVRPLRLPGRLRRLQAPSRPGEHSQVAVRGLTPR